MTSRRPGRPRRWAKPLDAAPSLFDARPGGDAPTTGRRRFPGSEQAVVGETGRTGEDAELGGAAVAERADWADVKRAARAFAARLEIAPHPTRRAHRAGSGDVTSHPDRGRSDEIDLDRTLDVLAERRPLRADEIFVRERRRRRRAVVLLADISGSMRGERIKSVAAVVGALSSELARERLSVLAFWSDAAFLSRFDESVSLEETIDRLLDLRAAGLTNLAFPLEVAAQELARTADEDRRVLLLSDCLHNAGPDPASFAGRLPRLDVLLDAHNEHDLDTARDLARAGRGLVLPVRGHADVPNALARIFER